MTESDNNSLSVRELRESDIEFIVRYWLSSDPAFLTGMGVDLDKLPTEIALYDMLREQLRTPVEQKRSYCIIWQLDGKPIGHCNTNPTVYSEDAYMHLHIWNSNGRKKGMGVQFVKMTLNYFFENLKLKKLYSEPFALNPAPNRTLEKVGFDFVKEYITVPGSLNFEQPVKRWELDRKKFYDVVLAGASRE